MEIIDHEHNAIRIISVTGRLDASTAPALQQHFEAIVSTANKSFVLDLQGVDYLSSGGLRVLLVMTKKVKAVGGGLVLTNLHPFVEDLLTMAGFDKLIPTTASKEDAITLLEKGETA